jgi:hypothetical protein
MAAYPHHRGFNQKTISQIAGYDQKSAHKRLRKLLELGLIMVAGNETYANLRGNGNNAKTRPIYSIPLDELDRLSTTLAISLVVQWEHRLFEGVGVTPQFVEGQIALDLDLDPRDPLSDQHRDPIADLGGGDSSFRDPIADLGADPIEDLGDDDFQADDRLSDQESHGASDHRPSESLSRDPIADQHRDPIEDHVSKEVSKEGDALTARPENTETGVPAAPVGETPMSMHPLALWGQLSTQQRPIDTILLEQLASEHNASTGGYGWYWVGRAILTTAMGAEPSDWWAKIRATMRRWRDTDTYGSDAPAGARRTRPTPAAPSPVPPAPSPGAKLSDLPILLAKGITGRERADMIAKFRRAAAAGDTATQQRILSDLAERTNDPTDRTV